MTSCLLVAPPSRVAEVQAFVDVFGSLRGSVHMDEGSGHLEAEKDCLRKHDNIVDIGKYQIRLTDDEPLGDDPGGWYVTVWEWKQGDYYLQRGYPAQVAYEKTQGRNAFYLSMGRYIKGADRKLLGQWLEQRI